jgi:hypothetical protein
MSGATKTPAKVAGCCIVFCDINTLLFSYSTSVH